MSDPFGLQRFVDAQAQTYAQALSELRDGAKRTHWMWFVFPQLAGLGRSGMAQRFALSGLEEARAYAAHPTLGRRLVESARALAVPDEPVFREVLDHYFGGALDGGTTSRLSG